MEQLNPIVIFAIIAVIVIALSILYHRTNIRNLDSNIQKALNTGFDRDYTIKGTGYCEMMFDKKKRLIAIVRTNGCRYISYLDIVRWEHRWTVNRSSSRNVPETVSYYIDLWMRNPNAPVYSFPVADPHEAMAKLNAIINYN